eukprot:GHVL01017152.1.p1 GENE.GHVL01017152.1~~GHVL01017152.1.p1  ORF type:complete len:797 (+),score=153.26 GHVL01017152.1:682-3072(+)
MSVTDYVSYKTVIPDGVVSPQRRHLDLPLGNRSIGMQESLLLEDLLFCMAGIHGTYITISGGFSAEKLDPSSISTPQFAIPDHLQEPGALPSFIQMVQQILPACEQHKIVADFIRVHQNFEYGVVSQAFCAALRQLLREFMVRLCQLETLQRRGELSLLKLWYYLQPCLLAFEMLAAVCKAVFKCKGGQLLNGVQEFMHLRNSTKTARSLCEFLLAKTSVPYLKMLENWIYEGVIEDVWGEFFVIKIDNYFETEMLTSDKKSVRRNIPHNLWKCEFKLNTEKIPFFLYGMEEKILQTGEYLNYLVACNRYLMTEEENTPGGSNQGGVIPQGGVLPQGGVNVDSRKNEKCFTTYPIEKRMKLPNGTKDFSVYRVVIEKAYSWAAGTLMEVIMGPLALKSRLRSMKRFFFLDQADFFYQFMDAAEDELDKPLHHLSITKIQNSLDASLRSSSVSADPYRDNVSCIFQPFILLEGCKKVAAEEDEAATLAAIQNLQEDWLPNRDLTRVPTDGIHALTLTYSCKGPLELILSPLTFHKCQLIFRHVLVCKYAERRLSQVWMDHQLTKEVAAGAISAMLMPAYSIRQRMLHFCRNYVYYVTLEVLEPQFHKFMKLLDQAENLDQVLKLRNSFLDRCLKEGLLIDHLPLLKSLSKILSCCSLFASNLRQFTLHFDDVKARTSTTNPTTLNQQSNLRGAVAGGEGGGTVKNAPRGVDVKAQFDRRQMVLEVHSTYISSIMSEGKYSEMIGRFAANFDRYLNQFLISLVDQLKRKYDSHLINLLTRLDYNHYYSNNFNKMENDI